MTPLQSHSHQVCHLSNSTLAMSGPSSNGDVGKTVVWGKCFSRRTALPCLMTCVLLVSSCRSPSYSTISGSAPIRHTAVLMRWHLSRHHGRHRLHLSASATNLKAHAICKLQVDIRTSRERHRNVLRHIAGWSTRSRRRDCDFSLILFVRHEMLP